MRVFLVGASGAIATRLVSQLIEQGREVFGTFRSPRHAERVPVLGAEPIALPKSTNSDQPGHTLLTRKETSRARGATTRAHK
jgi:nucleoside-diphosphate-sugar epimerase